MRKFIATLLLIALPAMPALAGKPDKSDKGKGHGNSQGSQGKGQKDKSKHDGDGGWRIEHDDHDHSPRFSYQDRDYWRDYWHQEYQHGKCPPGLAKKHNGCMPPGQAKKRYQVGHPLPSGVVLVPVPAVLLPRLPVLSPGYRYGMIDGDLVKLAVGTLLVVDAIQGLTNY
jgi:hypothetical protein